jgi:hypothetical protein
MSIAKMKSVASKRGKMLDPSIADNSRKDIEFEGIILSLVITHHQ